MTREEVKQLQKTLNALGANLDPDGIRGPLTIAAEKKYLHPDVIPALPKLNPKDYFGASWIGANIDLLGRDESDADLNARYVPEWKLEGLPGYKSLVGNARAWCSVKVNADFRKVGIKGTNSAGAYSWSNWGKKCPFWFGCVLDIKHKSGGRHVAFFLYWIDVESRIAAVYGGNQGNRMSIVSQTINAGGDVCVTGPRWPTGQPDGQFVSKADVLKAYPHLKVGGKGGSTR